MNNFALVFKIMLCTTLTTLQVPSMNDAALPSPTEHAQMMAESDGDCNNFSSTFEPVASSPETGQKQPRSSEWEESNSTEQRASLMQRIVRWVWLC